MVNQLRIGHNEILLHILTKVSTTNLCEPLEHQLAESYYTRKRAQVELH